MSIRQEGEAMNLIIKMKENCRVKSLELGGCSVGYQYGITEGRKTIYINISFNGEKCTSLEFLKSLYLKVTALEICGGTEQDWAEIESMTWFQEGRSYEFAPIQFGIFQKIDVKMPNGKIKRVRMDLYQAIVKQANEEEQETNLLNALECQETEEYKNIYAFIREHVKEAAEIFSRVQDYTGEEEQQAIDDIVSYFGNAVCYKIVSNKGTPDEQEDETYLFPEQAEKIKAMLIKDTHEGEIRDLDNTEIFSVEGNKIKLKDIDVLTEKNA
jgi:hypothetical protein